jgi:hypothetical protein
VIPLLVFLVLLTNKLDDAIRISYFSASTPLFLTFVTLILASFGARGGELKPSLYEHKKVFYIKNFPIFFAGSKKNVFLYVREKTRVARFFSTQYTKIGENIANYHNIAKWPYNQPNDRKIFRYFSFQRPFKIYPNWDFWFENKPSGNLGVNQA